MATVGLLVAQGHNHLRYLVTCTDATALVITSSGAASPDLLTDTIAGPLRKMAKAFTAGYGKVAAASLSTAQAKAIWLDDNSGADIGSNATIPRAQCRVQERSGATEWIVDATASANLAVITLTPTNAAGSCYLDIFVPGAIGT